MSGRLLYVAVFLGASLGYAQRITMSLDGTWSVAESAGPDEMPRTYGHQGPVPGLANLARPAFAGVDQFDSRELLHNRIRRGELPKNTVLPQVGVTRQQRNYFWYRHVHAGGAARRRHPPKVNKAQFGTAVWLNGRKIGEHFGCFTAGISISQRP